MESRSLCQTGDKKERELRLKAAYSLHRILPDKCAARVPEQAVLVVCQPPRLVSSPPAKRDGRPTQQSTRNAAGPRGATADSSTSGRTTGSSNACVATEWSLGSGAAVEQRSHPSLSRSAQSRRASRFARTRTRPLPRGVRRLTFDMSGSRRRRGLGPE